MTGYSFSIAYAAVLPAVNGPEGEGLNWDSVDWRAQEAIVRRLRQRIFKATREGDWPNRPHCTLRRPRGLLEPCAATSCTHGSEGPGAAMRSPDLLPALHRTDRGRRAVGVSAIADGASAVAVGVVADRIHRSDRWRYRTGAAAVRVRSPPSPRYAHRVRNKVHRSTVRYRLHRIRELSCTSSMANGRRR